MRPSSFCIDASIVQASCLDRREIGDSERRHGRAGGGVVCGRLGVHANVGRGSIRRVSLALEGII